MRETVDNGPINPLGAYVDRNKTHVDRHRGKTREVPIFRTQVRSEKANKYDPAREDQKHARQDKAGA